MNSKAGDDAAGVINKLAHSKAAPPDLSVSNEGTAGSTFGSPQGAFMVNWTYIYHNYDSTQPEVAKDIGYTRYPQTVAGDPSKPPYGGIGIGVSAYSGHVDDALKAAECLVSPKNQGVNAELTGNMPASPAGYQYPPLQKLYPPALLALFQQSVDAAAPRSVTPYWSDISGALLSTWHPPASVNQSTPQKSADFMRAGTRREDTAMTTVTEAPAAKPAARRRAQLSDRAAAENRLGRRLVAPAVVVMLVVTAYPMFQALYLSLFRYRLTDPNAKEFVGLSNYGTVLTDSLFWKDTWNTVLIMVVTVAVELVIGFAFAMVMHRIIIGRGLMRTAILIPYGIVTVGLGVRLAVRLQHQQRLHQRLVPVAAMDQPGHQLVRHRTGPRCSRSWSRRSGRPRRSCRCCCSPASRRSPTTCSRPLRSTAPPGGSVSTR